MNKLNKFVMLMTIVSFLFGQTGFVFAKVSPKVSFDAAGQNLFSARPTIVRIPIDEYFVDQSCGFDVGVHITGTVVDISYTDANGVFHEFQAGPQVRLELTRLDTGNSMTFNISGPAHITVNPDGSNTLTGTGS